MFILREGKLSDGRNVARVDGSFQQGRGTRRAAVSRGGRARRCPFREVGSALQYRLEEEERE